MKRLFALLLALCAALMPCALAEVAEAPRVDLTSAFVAVLLLVFELLLAWIAKVIVPPLKSWLEKNVSEKQSHLLWDAICKLVDAAEQTIRGPGRGKERLDYVIEGLWQRGFEVDQELIEAAVKQMNERMRATIGAAFAETSEADDPE